MNAFIEASKVEQFIKATLLPRLQARFDEVCDTNIEFADEFRLLVQKAYGDYLVRKGDDVWSIETKAEAKWTGNLFLETWSNRSRQTLGWMHTSHADLLFYCFIDKGWMYTLCLPALQRWAFNSGPEDGIHAYTEKPQRKYEQINDTWGCPVPIETISKIPGICFKNWTL